MWLRLIWTIYGTGKCGFNFIVDSECTLRLTFDQGAVCSFIYRFSYRERTYVCRLSIEQFERETDTLYSALKMSHHACIKAALVLSIPISKFVPVFALLRVAYFIYSTPSWILHCPSLQSYLCESIGSLKGSVYTVWISEESWEIPYYSNAQWNILKKTLKSSI